MAQGLLGSTRVPNLLTKSSRENSKLLTGFSRVPMPFAFSWWLSRSHENSARAKSSLEGVCSPNRLRFHHLADQPSKERPVRVLSQIPIPTVASIQPVNGFSNQQTTAPSGLSEPTVSGENLQEVNSVLGHTFIPRVFKDSFLFSREAIRRPSGEHSHATFCSSALEDPDQVVQGLRVLMLPSPFRVPLGRRPLFEAVPSFVKLPGR